MKRLTIFAIILSLTSFVLIGCSGGDEGAGDNSVNKESTVKADFNKPAAPDNPGGLKNQTPQ